MAHYSQDKLLVSMMKNPRKNHTYAITKDVADERELTKNKTGNCPMYEKGHHDIEHCPTFLIQPVQDRSKTIFKKKLC